MRKRRSAYFERQSHGEAAPNPCDHPGCEQEGHYRAPRSRDDVGSYYWFCLDHVRSYNAAWNYFSGMSDADVEAHMRRDTVWERPTWPMGGRSERRFNDRTGLFGEDEAPGPEQREPLRRPPRTPEERAMALLAVDPPVTMERVRARYLILVKQYHPDANGGDPAAEEQLKQINQAYATLKGFVLGEARRLRAQRYGKRKT